MAQCNERCAQQRKCCCFCAFSHIYRHSGAGFYAYFKQHSFPRDSFLLEGHNFKQRRDHVIEMTDVKIGHFEITVQKRECKTLFRNIDVCQSPCTGWFIIAVFYRRDACLTLARGLGELRG